MKINKSDLVVYIMITLQGIAFLCIGEAVHGIIEFKYKYKKLEADRLVRDSKLLLKKKNDLDTQYLKFLNTKMEFKDYLKSKE